LSAKEYGLPKDSVVLLEQIRTIDKKRLREKIGHLDDELMEKVNEALHKFWINRYVKVQGVQKMKNLNFNKNSGKIVLVAVLCAIVIHIVQVAYGSVTAESVSEDDTLVSLSYVNSKFQKMAKSLKKPKKGLKD